MKWLHIEVNPAQVKIWEEVARAFEAKHPGVKVEMQFLENEAYKAKLPTILQSRDRPHIIYSWAGGVLKAQIEAGVLEDITAAVEGLQGQSGAGARSPPSRMTASSTACRIAVSQVGFMYNKELFAKANVDGRKIKTWDDLLAAVKALKAAGVTPIVVGGADKWPLHFYWTHLAVRLGGKAGFEAALKGENGGFEGEMFQKSGELFKQLVDLQPFQNGFLGFKNPQAVGYFGDGKAAMTLAISLALSPRSARLSADKQGSATRRSAGSIFPMPPGAQGRADRYARRRQRLADHQGRAEGGGRVRQVLHLQGRADAAGAEQLPDPDRQGRGGRHRHALPAQHRRRTSRARTITRTSTTRRSVRRSGASSTTSRRRSPAAA